MMKLLKKYFLFIIGIIILITLSCKDSITDDNANNDCAPNEYINAPNKSFFVAFNASEEESHGHYILECSDGGYLQIGETGLIPNTAKILAVKTDRLGNLLWQREFSVSGHNLGNSTIETNDGYLICGAINENSALIKINKESGSTIFQKTFDNGGSDAFEHLTLFQNGIIAVGYVNAMDNTNTFYTAGQAYVTYLDNKGNKTNELNLKEYLSHAYRIKAYNNELIISGLTDGAKNYGLVKLDNNGLLVWAKEFGGAGADHCFGMDLSNDGSMFLTGHTLSETQNWDTYTMKIDNDGNLIWEAKKGNPRGFDPNYIHDESWDVKSTNDGGCIIVAGTGDEYDQYHRICNNGNNSDIWDVYLIKFSKEGNVEWQKTYGSNNGQDWAGEAIDLTSDGGAIVAVDNGQFGFMKIEPF